MPKQTAEQRLSAWTSESVLPIFVGDMTLEKRSLHCWLIGALYALPPAKVIKEMKERFGSQRYIWEGAGLRHRVWELHADTIRLYCHPTHGVTLEVREGLTEEQRLQAIRWLLEALSVAEGSIPKIA